MGHLKEPSLTMSATKVAKTSAEYLKLPVLELRTAEDVFIALTDMGVVPAVFCVFMLCALVTARIGPFARHTKLEVTNAVQGYAIWWIMKHFLIAAAEKGVRIPGLETEPINGNGPSQCAAMLITANMKLEQFEHQLTASNVPLPSMLDIYFRTAPNSATDPEKEGEGSEPEEGTGINDEDEDDDCDFE